MHLSAPVVLWTLFGLIGFVVALEYTVDNWRDLPAVAPNPIEYGYAQGRLLVSVAIMLAEGIVAGLGILTIAFDPTRFTNELIVWALVVLAGLLAVVVILLRLNKRRLRRRLESQREIGDHS